MTIQDIVDGFVAQLIETFEYDVYDEEIPQGLKIPSFHVNLTKLEFKRLVGLQRKYEMFISATYFPKDKRNKKTEYNDIMQKITEQFDYLHLEDKVLHLNVITQGENERDDALVFLFKLNIETRKKIKDDDLMGTIEVEVTNG